MKYDNSETKKLVKDCFKEIDGITDVLRDCWSVSEFSNVDFKAGLSAVLSQLEDIKRGLQEDYGQITQELDLTLIALEAYTEGKVSWERAGEISGLHIFGLRNYCDERDVDWCNLRIDEYMGFTGPEAEKTICEEWDKLMSYKKA